ncbi:MAG: cysteine-rich CWC family protein [Burkholderiales bacterium]|nr:cysteine-rich CWC family protein [Burkholderiales bacterium]
MVDAPAPDDRCPRCGGGFHCGAQDTAPCPCTTLKLDAPTLAALRQRYTGCLCLRCLGELAQQGIAMNQPQH